MSTDNELIREEPMDCENEPTVNSGAAFSSAVNQNIVHDMVPAETALRMSMNAGKVSSDKHGKLPGMEHKMWINPEGTANTASPGDPSDQCHVYFNDAEEDAFVVQEWDDVEGRNTMKFP